MNNDPPYTQRDIMRALVEKYGRENQIPICRHYAKLEIKGKVDRKRNIHNMSALDYAYILYNDGYWKGWF